ncbi:Uncharacterized protein PECH_002129 [Penicillium ucsense]|uniref:Uncharacterized protein n=1 Tax=Penicillium ucsense TaxID=2839758 RepID=A0A8J8WHQ2_9EURO|nr:Uncharacterized protein PECM_007183 [Penicillium ucsense]KAF7738084.1 Uncharacterized protein PECH_002129 [Penicillium ucsense]
MDCFKQIFRTFKAPFARKQGKIVEIGPPTNFRKEELPACFSDAESVLTRNLTPSERPHLTSQSQYFDVSDKPQPIGGEGGSVQRDDEPSAIGVSQDPQPRPQTERATFARVRTCLKGFRMSVGSKKPPTGHSEATNGGDDTLFGTITEKAKSDKPSEQ